MLPRFWWAFWSGWSADTAIAAPETRTARVSSVILRKPDRMLPSSANEDRQRVPSDRRGVRASPDECRPHGSGSQGSCRNEIRASAREAMDCGRQEPTPRSEEHTSELQSLAYLVCRL